MRSFSNREGSSRGCLLLYKGMEGWRAAQILCVFSIVVEIEGSTEATMAELYNTLPTLADAEERFTHREQIFVACRSLLAKYENNFGICLVHAHCNLSDGEIMLARGNVSQPEKISKLAEYYPERWLSSGTPYEFTTRLTTAPPVALVEAFNQLTVQLGVLDLVGELPGMLPRMLPGLLPSSSSRHK